MLTVLLFILVLGLLVLVHEFGHFYAAKKAGCYVEEFAIGFPPRLFKVQGKETVYTINLLPLGGFVKIRGEDGGDSNDPRSFAGKSLLQKSFIILAGVGMNIVLAYVLITSALIIGVPTILAEDVHFPSIAKINNKQVQIVSVLDSAPAKSAGLETGDVIISINDETIEDIQEVQGIFNQEMPSATSLTIKRGEETINLSVTPQPLQEIEGTGIGVSLTETATIAYPWYFAPFYAIERTLMMLWAIIAAFVGLIAKLFTTGTVNADIAGPIGIAALTGQVAKLGIVHLIQFTAILSLNLAVINALPFPALDGSRFTFILLESLRGKRLKVRTEQWINTFGFGLLMLLMIFVTVKDLQNYGGSILSAIQGLFS